MTETQLDPAKSNFVTIVGRKGSGKSVLARSFWDDYPFDRIVVDPTGDVDPGDERAERLAAPMPARWPVDAEGRRVTLRYVPDVRSPTWVDDMDRAVGLAYWHPHKRCLAWLDEIGAMTRANQTEANLRQALHQGRHRNLSLLMCGPRPIDINPLVLSQADYVAVFDLPNPRDRERVASTIGISPTDFDAEHGRLEEYGFLWYEAKTHELTVMDPLPLRRRRTVAPEHEEEGLTA
jgi:hypothetical protein